MGRFLQFLKELPLSRKISLLVVLLGTVGVILFAVKATQKFDFVALYRGLDPEDMSTVIEYLKQQKVPYRVDPLSSSVMVPAEKVYQLRMDLASKGIPSGGKVGFEIFDKTKLGMGEFVQKVNYRRALEGELARSIMKLDAVRDCRVHIVLPKDSPFVGERIEARASVILDMKMGRRLTPEEVEAIRHLVASAVEGLDPDDVSVVDTKGRLLSGRPKGSVLGATSDQIALQREWEKSLEEKIVSLLEPVVGPGKVIARVSSEWDWKQVRQRQELFQSQPVVRSRQITEETTAGTPPFGIPGVASNIRAQGAAARRASATAGKLTVGSTRRTEIVNYEVGRSLLEVTEPMGKLKRLSVAVLVDGKYQTVGEGEAKRVEFVPLGQEELSRIEQIVRDAVGLDPARGDRLTVVSLPFRVEEEEVAPPEKPFPIERVLWAMKYLVPLIVALLVIFVIIRPLMRSVLEARVEVVQRALPPEREAEEEMEVKAPPVAEATLRLAKEDIDYTVGMVRKWLKEEEGGRR